MKKLLTILSTSAIGIGILMGNINFNNPKEEVQYHKIGTIGELVRPIVTTSDNHWYGITPGGELYYGDENGSIVKLFSIYEANFSALALTSDNHWYLAAGGVGDYDKIYYGDSTGVLNENNPLEISARGITKIVVTSNDEWYAIATVGRSSEIYHGNIEQVFNNGNPIFIGNDVFDIAMRHDDQWYASILSGDHHSNTSIYLGDESGLLNNNQPIARLQNYALDLTVAQNDDWYVGTVMGEVFYGNTNGLLNDGNYLFKSNFQINVLKLDANDNWYMGGYSNLIYCGNKTGVLNEGNAIATLTDNLQIWSLAMTNDNHWYAASLGNTPDYHSSIWWGDIYL